jgi:hypothetical protein
MSRGIQDRNIYIFELKFIALPHGPMFKSTKTDPGYNDLRSCSGGQIHVTRDEVRMKMSLKDMGDAHSHCLRYGDVLLDIPPWVHNGTASFPPKKVREVRKPRDEKRLNVHDG